MTTDDLKDYISSAINKMNDIDNHAEILLDRVDNISVISEIEEEWDDQGKYSYGYFVYKISYKDVPYYISVSQSRSGSYFSSYFYDNMSIDDVQTVEEYEAPKELTSFEFRNKKIYILSNLSAKIDDNIFPTVEDAINSLI